MELDDLPLDAVVEADRDVARDDDQLLLPGVLLAPVDVEVVGGHADLARQADQQVAERQAVDLAGGERLLGGGGVALAVAQP